MTQRSPTYLLVLSFENGFIQVLIQGVFLVCAFVMMWAFASQGIPVKLCMCCCALHVLLGVQM